MSRGRTPSGAGARRSARKGSRPRKRLDPPKSPALHPIPAGSLSPSSGTSTQSTGEPTDGEHLKSFGRFTILKRVLTTASRKPPLRTDKFLGFRGEWLPQGLRYRAKVRRIRLLRTYLSPIRPRKHNEAGQGAKMACSNAKSAIFGLKTRRS
jgi:hypothetical protein